MCIMFYAKKGCSFCLKLENLLNEWGLPYKKHYPQQQEIDELKQKTSMKTFPMVFIGHECIGGFTEFQTLLISNELQKKLKLHGIDLEI